MISATVYDQQGRTVVHLNNRLLTSRVPGRQDRLVPIGPVRVSLKGKAAGQIRLLVSGKTVPAQIRDGWVTFDVLEILDHEVAVIE